MYKAPNATLPITANADIIHAALVWPPGGLGSRIDNQPSFSPTSTGFYMLAMTSFHNDALDGGAMMHSGGSSEFGQEPLTGTLDGWDVANGGGSGTYEILLTGVSFDACNAVGGELLPIDSTALILAGGVLSSSR